MHFKDYFRSAIRTSVLTGIALAVLFAVLLLSGVRATGSLTVDIEFGLIDIFWGFLAFPVALILLTLLASPVVFILLTVRRLLRRSRAESP